MKYFVNHYEDGYQVIERDGDSQILIASFPRGSVTRTGEKSRAQQHAEEYCDFLNQKDTQEDFMLDL